MEKNFFSHVLTLVGILLMTCGCQQKPYPIFFLSEADSAEGSSTKFILMYNGHPHTRMPLVTHEHIESYHSFMSMQDGSYGVVFTLKEGWRNRLYQMTQNRQGSLILPVVNSLAFQPLRVDGPITDGKLVIWNGLNGYDLKQIARDIRPENPEMEKKRFLKKNPRPLPKITPSTKNERKDHTGRTIGEIFPSGS